MEYLESKRHDDVLQGAKYIVADAIRLIDTARGNSHTAEDWRRRTHGMNQFMTDKEPEDL